jgi:hypothetical protein
MNGHHVARVQIVFSMKLATLVFILAAVSPNASRADDASVRSLHVAQMSESKPEHQATGACTPIGLTANGEIVFPWECRETIEKQRGPVTVNVPAVPNDPPSKDQPAKHQPASPNARPQDAVATRAPSQPVEEATVDRALLPPDANVASLPSKPLLHRRPFSADRHKEQPAALQTRPTVGGVKASNGVKTSNLVRTSNQDKVALQRGASQK